MKKINYSFAEITILANDNINLINNIVKLEKLGLIETSLDATKNEEAFKILEIDNQFLKQCKIKLNLDEDQMLEKEHLNEIFKTMNFKQYHKDFSNVELVKI